MSEKEEPEISLKSSKNKAKISKCITWDEDTIAMHDIERGTRMEINEPDTPYYYGSSNPSDDEEPYMQPSTRQKSAVDLNELSSRLFEYSNQIDNSPDYFPSSNNNDNANSPTHKSKRDLFKEKRKLHYKEFITAKSQISKDNSSLSDFDSDSESSTNYKPKS
ncbi:uncharacterized protein cubi_03262 [Cryptosporidium ubiquitum]|uniref:Protein phosphatase inhibitor 2 n=1 Tax=Cryptosporidium ubiquitum TaxID=857276 RepID=A0A1J4MD78_9CRYT|nr:uncharacterized protein cubi_03262 [Cryptosporidium ubiquitum]OII70964.1 hypothetical protein cubi_03262 [Cryptosporidium ubiquitum]